jgi:hypothetical protein
MGIDAEMLIRWRGQKPDDAMLNRLSWDLCRAVGAETFFVKDGLPSLEYHVQHKTWHEAFNAHPLYPEYNTAKDHDTRQPIHERIFADVGTPPEQRRRAIELTNTLWPLDDDSEVPPLYREPGRAYTQDGPPIYAEEGEWLMELNLWGRYYGIGYERGDLLKYCAVAEWLEQNLPGCVIYYGGDSCGVLAEPFNEEMRDQLKAHLYSQNGRDYFKERSSFGRNTNLQRPKPCGLCVPGEDRFNQYGYGASYAAVSCAGCGKNFVSRDGGATWAEAKDND